MAIAASEVGMENAWRDVLSGLERRLGGSDVETWFRQVELLRLDGDALVLGVPNRYVSEWIVDNYRVPLEEEIERAFRRRLVASWVADGEPATPAPAEEDGFPGHFRLNPSQTFETFVVGASNQFAHAASLNVSEAPGRTYNPLYIFGGVGLGKTHLLNAIGNRIRQRNPRARVVYLSAEDFSNEVINSIRYNRMDQLQEKYRRTCEVLLMDDIQFLESKPRTLEEFFHSFNALHSSGRRICVTSDRYPKDLDLPDRLKTRFEWGLRADILPPELETRVAILKRRADAEQVHLPDEVAMYIATHNASNVRKLEGSLTNLLAFSSFHGRPLSLAFAKELLGDFGEKRDAGPPSIERIQEVVARFSNLRVADLKGNRRSRVQTVPRQVAMYLCRKLTKHSFPEIGERFGRDHSTVMHAVRKIDEDIVKDADLRQRVETLERMIAGGREATS